MTVPKLSKPRKKPVIKRAPVTKDWIPYREPPAAPRINAVVPPVPTPPPPPVKTFLVEPDPLADDPRLGLLYIYACNRIRDFAIAHPSEVPAPLFTRTMITRLAGKDPTIRCLMVMTEDGEVVGHVLATIEGGPDARWVYCWQAQVDTAHTTALADALDVGRAWGKEQGATNIVMATFIDPEFWKRRYGFQDVRHVMLKEIT